MSGTNTSFAIMDSLMDAIECNDVWSEIQLTDPRIQRAEQAFHAAAKEAKAILPQEVFQKLLEATSSVESAVATASILYGMQVHEAISTATARQVDFSQYILNRMNQQAGED